jgi:predicted ATPase
MQDWKIERISIQGFKSIKDMELSLYPLNILIGANGAGKSNFLQAFRLLKDVVEERLQLSVAQAGFADRILHFGNKSTRAIHFDIEFSGQYGYYLVLITAAGDKLLIGEEIVKAPPPHESWLISGEAKESGLKAFALDNKSGDQLYQTIRQWRVYHFQDTGTSSAIKKAVEVRRGEYLQEDGANLAAFLYSLRNNHPKYYERIRRTVRMVLPFFHDFYLQPDSDNPDIVIFRWQENRAKTKDQLFDADDMSDGALRFICLTTLLLQPDPPCLMMIDEPELGLHPHAIGILSGMLTTVSTKSQVIVSTQSPGLVDQFDAEDIVVVDREGEASSFKRLKSDALKEWISEYTLSELWDKNVIGGIP